MKNLFVLFLLFLISLLSAQESENTRIAREHQYGGKYNPRYEKEEVIYSPVWGIIALDTINLSRWGYSHSQISLEDAKKRAMELCEEKGYSCTVIASYTRDTCGGIARTPKEQNLKSERLKLGLYEKMQKKQH